MAKKQNMPAEQKNEVTFISKPLNGKRLFEELQAFVSRNNDNYVIQPNFGDEAFSCLTVYIKANPSQCKGMHWPDGMGYCRRMTLAEMEEFQAWANDMKLAAQSASPEIDAESKLIVDICTDVLQELAFSVKSKNIYIVKMQEYLHKMLDPGQFYDEPRRREVVVHYEKAGEIRGANGFIPPRDWFAPSVQTASLQDLLPNISEPIARELFALAIGRAIWGPTGWTNACGSKLQHDWRSMVVLQGLNKSGKSTIVNALSSAFKSLGFRVVPFNSLNMTFNMGPILTSDLAIASDMKSTELKHSTESNIFKQIVNSEPVYVQNKGVDGYNMFPTALFMACANELDSSTFVRGDSGTHDRLLIIKTDNIEVQRQRLNSAELSDLSRESPNLSPYYHWRYLAEKLDCDVQALIFWLMRLCMELFESRCIEHDGAIEANYISRLKQKLEFAVPLQNEVSMLKGMMLAYYMLQPDEAEQMLDKHLDSIAFCEMFKAYWQLRAGTDNGSTHDKFWEARTIIKRDWLAGDVLQGHAWQSISNISLQSLKAAELEFRKLCEHSARESSGYTLTLDKAINATFGSLRINGHGLHLSRFEPDVTQTYAEVWKCRETLKSLADKCRATVTG